MLRSIRRPLIALIFAIAVLVIGTQVFLRWVYNPIENPTPFTLPDQTQETTSIKSSPTPEQIPTQTSLPTVAEFLASPNPTQQTTPAFPIRLAFYYPWFPEAWNQKHLDPYTNYHPLAGWYDSSSLSVISQHISDMQYGNIQAGIASWWGQGSPTDKRLPALLESAKKTGFHWTLYYEAEGNGNPSVDQIRSDLTYIRDHYATNPAFLKIQDRFVIFVYGEDSDSCATADRWKQANTVGAYVNMKVFPGYKNCASQLDAWHQYAPANAYEQVGTSSVTISPGFWKAGESPRLDRDFSRWYADIQKMVATQTQFQLVTTFNEWGEGTAVEPANEWTSSSGYGKFLDALHVNGQNPLPTP